MSEWLVDFIERDLEKGSRSDQETEDNTVVATTRSTSRDTEENGTTTTTREQGGRTTTRTEGSRTKTTNRGGRTVTVEDGGGTEETDGTVSGSTVQTQRVDESGTISFRVEIHAGLFNDEAAGPVCPA